LFVLYPYPQYPAHYQKSGVVLRICQQRLSSNTTLAGIKHLNRLEQVLARAEWQDDCYAEGLMLDLQGKLIEGTMSNVFLRYGSDWYTPSLHTCGVAGIMRALVMELAASVGICIVEREVDAKILHQAEEIFITNSVIGIWPVCQLEQSVLNIGSQTRNLQKLLLALRVAESQHA
jgi:4-amino-4-deoxychorismate lyase